jgi:hypothetical protein
MKQWIKLNDNIRIRADRTADDNVRVVIQDKGFRSQVLLTFREANQLSWAISLATGAAEGNYADEWPR